MRCKSNGANDNATIPRSLARVNFAALARKQAALGNNGLEQRIPPRLKHVRIHRLTKFD